MKREVVEATLSGEQSVSVVARRYDINANVVFRGRRQYRDGVLPASAPSASLVPVTIVTDAGSAEGAVSASSAPRDGTLELILPNGTQMKLIGDVCPDTLRVVLDRLAG